MALQRIRVAWALANLVISPLQPGSWTDKNKNCNIPLNNLPWLIWSWFWTGNRLMNRKSSWVIYQITYSFIFIHKNLLSSGTSCKIIGRRNNVKVSNRVLLSPENTVLHLHKRSQKDTGPAEGKRSCINTSHIATVPHKKGRAQALNFSFQLALRNLKLSLLKFGARRRTKGEMISNYYWTHPPFFHRRKKQ